tara:strand:- start:207 stop:419 length:213 start_codon:yes stop_codon:yes gene_type:complete
MKIREDGQAKMSITLDHGFIKVKRTSGLELANWYANKGDWDRIWNTINKMVKKNKGFSLSLKEKEKRDDK